jgi:hypothetical protein
MPDNEIPESIEHLDSDMDQITRIVMYAREEIENEDEEIYSAVLVTRSPDGPARVFFLGHPDHAIVTMQRGVKLVERLA